MIDNLNFKDFQRTISVTPNPFNNYFIIEGVENDLIELYDLHGKILQSKFNDNVFDTESLKRGVYILFIKGKNISFKLVKS